MTKKSRTAPAPNRADEVDVLLAARRWAAAWTGWTGARTAETYAATDALLRAVHHLEARAVKNAKRGAK